jgi:ferric-chelate reductase [NAD(P)H]
MNLKILEKISYGMYIISSKNNSNKINAQIADAVIQITSQPPKIAIAINNNNLTCDFIKESDLFCISILPENFPLKMIGLFGFRSGRKINKFENLNYKLTANGLPYLAETLGFIECKVINKINEGTHTLFTGEVIDCEFLNDASPMTYSYYHEIKRGGNSKNAPHYNKE